MNKFIDESDPDFQDWLFNSELYVVEICEKKLKETGDFNKSIVKLHKRDMN